MSLMESVMDLTILGPLSTILQMPIHRLQALPLCLVLQPNHQVLKIGDLSMLHMELLPLL